MKLFGKPTVSGESMLDESGVFAYNWRVYVNFSCRKDFLLWRKNLRLPVCVLLSWKRN